MASAESPIAAPREFVSAGFALALVSPPRAGGDAGAALASVDFDGAIVFDEGFLTALRAASLDQSFAADRFALEPLPPEIVIEHPQFLNLDTDVLAELETGAVTAYRVTRIGEFEDDATGGTIVLDR